MANGLVSFSGKRAVGGEYNLWQPGDFLFYVVDTAVLSVDGAFADLCNIAIPAMGTWRVEGQFNSAALGSESATSIAVSIYSANTTTDHVTGRNVLNLGKVAAAVGSGRICDIITVANLTTVAYLKGKTTGAGGSVMTGSLLLTMLQKAS